MADSRQTPAHSAFLNSLEPSPSNRSIRETLFLPINTMAVKAETPIQPQGSKRPMRDEDYDFPTEDSLTSPRTSDGSELSTLSLPRKKSKLNYREPEPVLLSTDLSTLFKFFESPIQSHKQICSSPNTDLTSPLVEETPVLTSNSESIREIIQQYESSNLDSFKVFELSPSNSVDIQPKSCVASTRPGQKETALTPMTSPLFINTDVSPIPGSLFQVSSSEVVETVLIAGNCNSENLQSSTLMSCDLEIVSHTHVSSSVSQQSHAVLEKNHSDFTTHQVLLQQKGQVSEIKLVNTSVEDGDHKTNNVINNQDSDCPSAEKDHSTYHQGVGEDDSDEDSEDDFSDDDSLEKYHQFEDDPLELIKCKKNKGHKKFFSPAELKVMDLPPEIQSEDSLTFFNCLSQLIVQITVSSTSAARGKYDSNMKYIGTNSKRNGSGFISSVDEEIMRIRCKRENCPYALPDSTVEDTSSVSSPCFNRSLSNISTCSTFSNGSRGHYYYSGVNIYTNRHVVYDLSEALNASVKFFFNTPDGVGVIQGHVSGILGVNPSQDRVVLHVISHDKSLFNTIRYHMKNAKSSYEQMVESTAKLHKKHDPKNSWAAIISHPHGMCKKISLGCVKKEVVGDSKIRTYYDAATCRGSSGGLVTTYSLLKLQWPGAVHSCTDHVTKFNVTFDSRAEDLHFDVINKINSAARHKKKKKNYNSL